MIPWKSLFLLFAMLSNLSAQEWPFYGATPGGTRWSPLRQIHATNVHRLKPVWTFRCEDARLQPPTTIECNPLMVNGTLFLGTPTLHVVALDAATGQKRWEFNPWQGGGGGGVSRGFAYWTDGRSRRLFTSAGVHLIALDADTGLPAKAFGKGGRIDLREGLDRELLQQNLSLTTPGVVYRDLLIIGSQVGDSPNAKVPGHIRAYDVRTGQRRWIFHTIPHPGEKGHETWPEEAWRTAAGCNAWGGLVLDERLGMVFCGTGSPAYDHFGGDRPGQNLFGNSVLALDAATGLYRWHFQVIHHDLWDYDLPCPPVLASFELDGRRVDAAVQATKTGHLFVLDRLTGRPLFPVEERAVPASKLPGEQAWPTQPFPVKPPPIAQQGFGEGDITDLSPEASRSVREQLKKIRPVPLFTPPELAPTVTHPQFNGGAEWGGQAFDPESGILYINASNEAEWISMVPAQPVGSVSLHALGEHLFGAMCTQCHGTGRPVTSGAPPPPALEGLRARVPRADVEKLLMTGRNQMPSFAANSDLERRALVAFLYGDGKEVLLGAGDYTLDWANRIRYVATGHHDFRDAEGYPVNRRPWGTLSAVDLKRGALLWQVPLGTYPELEKRGYPPTGTFNLGGPVVTAGGLVFIGATRDERFRAFDKRTGKVLWEFQMTAGGYATPATYEVNGRQYVIIAAGGGGKAETRAGDSYWCFALDQP